MNKAGKRTASRLTLLAGLLAATWGAQAAGLGKLTVYSGIGQPLHAEVALTATPSELASLAAKLAPPEAFLEAGIEYMPAIAGMRFEIVRLPGGKALLKLTTERTVSEPFLHFLVELNWSAGRMLREYTFLLDPPEALRVARPASVVAPVVPRAPAAAMPPVREAPAGVPGRAAAPSGEYLIKQGDTLSGIAREAKPGGVSLDQMLAALFESNRAAFAGDNMNRLRAGKILRIPAVEQAAAIDPVEARKLVVAQAGEFEAYRRRLAAAAGAAPAAAEGAPQQQVAGAIKPRVEEKAPAAASDKLEVSSTEPAKPAVASKGDGSLEEYLIARDKAQKEAEERIALLEKNIEDLKRLVEIKSGAGTSLQQESQTVPPKPEEAKPAAPAQPAAESEPNFVEENPQLVFGGGGLLALLLGYLGYSVWRRKQRAAAMGEDIRAEPAAGEAQAVEPAVPAVAAEEEDIDISIQGDTGDAGALSGEEIVDPIAEADVLMAYGRDQQAEEILLEGLKHDPARTAIHLKLLELYAKQENLAQFETVAAQLHHQCGGRGAEWGRTVAMAHALGLSGGIFLGREGVGVEMPAAPAESELPAAPAAAPAPVEAGVAVIAASAAPAEEAVDSLDFDLDLGTTSRQPAPVAAAETAPFAAAEESMGFDFDFDLGTPEAAPPAREEPAEETAVPVTAAAESPAATLAEIPAASPPATAGGVDFDFDLDLDLPEPPQETASESENPEAATKLELAQAYEEMGDLDGARELLNEVLAEGSAAQQAQARLGLDRLRA